MALLASQKLRMRIWARRMMAIGMMAEMMPEFTGDMIQPRFG